MDRSSQNGKGAIETFIIDWPVLIFFGIVFAIFAPREGWWQSRAFLTGLIVAGLFTGSALVSYLVAPDWMWMYFIDPADARWTLPFMPFAYLVTYVLGFAAGVSFKQVSSGLAWAGAVAALFFEAGVVALTWDRYRAVGSTVEWASGNADNLFASPPAGPVLTISASGAVFVVGLVVGLILVWRSSRASAAGR
jgi:hypothetical protein